jgi:hypothetical protein
MGAQTEQAVVIIPRWNGMRVSMGRSSRHHENQQNTEAHDNKSSISSPVVE